MFNVCTATVSSTMVSSSKTPLCTMSCAVSRDVWTSTRPGLLIAAVIHLKSVWSLGQPLTR